MSEAFQATKEQLRLLHHTLGLEPECRTSYRNHFMAGEGHSDQQDLLVLHAAGLMSKQRAPEWMGGGDCFRCTDAGKEYALAHLPLPPKYSKYQQYLRSECCESFAEWLGIEPPRRENGSWFHGKEAEGKVRLVSTRATGGWEPTLKLARESYKKTMKANKAKQRELEASYG